MDVAFPSPRSHPRRQFQKGATTRRRWEYLREYGDTVAYVGDGATTLSVSRNAASEMRADGFPSDEIDRVRRRAIVEIDGSPMTVISGRQRRGRHYFRNRPRSLADKRARRRR